MTSTRRVGLHPTSYTGDDVGYGPFHPSLVVIGFFVGLMGVGTLLLSLPSATADGARASLLDVLFTAASAATGSGLVVRETGEYWSLTGQRIIFGLILLGGAGALVGSSLLLLIIAGHVTGEEKSLLKDFSGVQSRKGLLLISLGILAYALVVQAVGAYRLALGFSDSMPYDQALWIGAFHAASAFNNAGFDIIGLDQQLPDMEVQLSLVGLSLLGSLSFLVLVDLLRSVGRRVVALDTKLVLLASFLLLTMGTAVILAAEANNPQTLGPLPMQQKLLSAFFHSVSARTTGLSTARVAAFSLPAITVILLLMFIGGSAGSTSGGVKVNSFALILGVVWSTLRGGGRLKVLGTEVELHYVQRALAVVSVSLMLVFGVMVALVATQQQASLLSILFETVSAFSTTGFSLGLTPELTPVGRALIILTMFAGRVGPLTLAFALSLRHQPTRYMYAEEAINLG
ncbi:MAG: Trk family potassium uptake protein [Chloroflexi bacterium]|nr:Trk family potassium uptake protein [Chloroflexota bacterium]